MFKRNSVDIREEVRQGFLIALEDIMTDTRNVFLMSDDEYANRYSQIITKFEDRIVKSIERKDRLIKDFESKVTTLKEQITLLTEVMTLKREIVTDDFSAKGQFMTSLKLLSDPKLTWRHDPWPFEAVRRKAKSLSLELDKLDKEARLEELFDELERVTRKS